MHFNTNLHLAANKTDEWRKNFVTHKINIISYINNCITISFDHPKFRYFSYYNTNFYNLSLKGTRTMIYINECSDKEYSINIFWVPSSAAFFSILVLCIIKLQFPLQFLLQFLLQFSQKSYDYNQYESFSDHTHYFERFFPIRRKMFTWPQST